MSRVGERPGHRGGRGRRSRYRGAGSSGSGVDRRRPGCVIGDGRVGDAGRRRRSPAGAASDASTPAFGSRSSVATSSDEIANTAPESRNGPTSGGSPSAAPTSAPVSASNGPATDPSVVAQSTSDMYRASNPGAATSVAANRACRPVAAPAPKAASPRNTSTIHPLAAAATTSTAPTNANAYPVASETWRPARTARRASGIATRAAPSTLADCASPASATTPVSSSTSNAATAMPEATPTPARS